MKTDQLSTELSQALFNLSEKIRYLAVYWDRKLHLYQRPEALEGMSSAESDRFEELLVNPTLLTLAHQRGTIDCGGLDYVIVAYGNFFQLVKRLEQGHISICLDQSVDLNELPLAIFTLVHQKFPQLAFA